MANKKLNQAVEAYFTDLRMVRGSAERPTSVPCTCRWPTS